MGADGGKTRVVVTGLGAVTPLGNSVPEYWRAICEGRSGVGPITRFDPKRLDCADRRRGQGLRSPEGDREEGAEEARPLHPVRDRRGRGGGRGRQDRLLAGRSDARRSARRLRDRRHPLHPRVAPGAPREGAEPGLAVLRAVPDRQHGVRAALHPLQAQGAELLGGDRLRDGQPRDRRRVPDHPAGGRRPDGRGRLGGDHRRAAHRRVRADEGAVHAERRADAGLAPVRRRSRRVRPRRGRGGRRAGEPRARAPARRAHLRRDRRATA